MAVVAVGTGGDEVADHHRQFQPRAGGDEAVQYKIPTPSSSRPQIYPLQFPPPAASSAPAGSRSNSRPRRPSWLTPPAAFARKPDHPAAAAATGAPAAVARARGPVAAPWLPLPAAFARRSGPAAPDPTPPEPRRATRRLGLGGATLDVFVAILRRLDQVEILMGPVQVYRSWRCAARDDSKLLSEQ